MPAELQYQRLKPQMILKTQIQLQERISKRFPTSGLSEVAKNLVQLADHAAVRAEQIRQPNLPLRILVGVLLALGLVLGILFFFSTEIHDLVKEKNLLEVGERILRVLFFLGAAVVFLYSLESRWKRRRALTALHELRAMAHVVDMHQVAKDPEGLVKLDPNSPEFAKYTTKSLFDLNRYLNYCNEMLAIVSKIAALYVQDFPDAATVTVVDQVENLCSGLSQRIWQKLMILYALHGLDQNQAPRDPKSPAEVPDPV